MTVVTRYSQEPQKLIFFIYSPSDPPAPQAARWKIKIRVRILFIEIEIEIEGGRKKRATDGEIIRLVRRALRGQRFGSDNSRPDMQSIHVGNADESKYYNLNFLRNEAI